MQKLLLGVAFVGIACSSAMAWDGTDSNSGASIEIGSGNLVREGRDIEVYDYEKGEFVDVTVEDINRSGSSVELNVYDAEAGEYRTFDMEAE